MWEGEDLEKVALSNFPVSKVGVLWDMGLSGSSDAHHSPTSLGAVLGHATWPVISIASSGAVAASLSHFECPLIPWTCVFLFS